MRKLSVLAVLLFCSVSMIAGGPKAQAAITWEFNYINPGSNIGFFDANQGQARRDALENLATQWGQKFGNTGHIVMDVKSEEDSNSNTLASAGSNAIDNPQLGFGHTAVIRNKVLNGNDLNGNAADGEVTVNWGINWETSSNPGDVDADEYDFQSTMFHELNHALGFAASIGQDGADAFGRVPGMPGSWDVMDKFLCDANGNAIINSGSYILNGSLWDAASVGGVDGLFFNGQNAMAANGGNPVALYSPGAWEDGSSGGSHLANTNSMMYASTGTGKSARDLSAVEIGIFQDLGYTVVPLPSAIMLLGPALIGLGALRRRMKG